MLVVVKERKILCYMKIGCSAMFMLHFTAIMEGDVGMMGSRDGEWEMKDRH